MKWLQTLLDQFLIQIQSGNSWILIIVVMIISVIGLLIFAFKRNILSDWAYESIIPIPKKYQQIPIVREWFQTTRGFRYTTKGENLHDLYKGLKTPQEIEMGCLFSGWAFVHCLQHFMIAFLCPKLVHFSFIYGIAWEVFESINSSHCVLDIFWNMSGCILGLLIRMFVFPLS